MGYVIRIFEINVIDHWNVRGQNYHVNGLVIAFHDPNESKAGRKRAIHARNRTAKHHLKYKEKMFIGFFDY